MILGLIFLGVMAYCIKSCICERKNRGTNNSYKVRFLNAGAAGQRAIITGKRKVFIYTMDVKNYINISPISTHTYLKSCMTIRYIYCGYDCYFFCNHGNIFLCIFMIYDFNILKSCKEYLIFFIAKC